MATLSTLLTTEDLLAMPDDGTRRWLVDGELKESPRGLRDRFNSAALASIGTILEGWLRQQPQPRGEVLGGEAGVRLQSDPDTTVGIDVVYVSPEVIARQTDESMVIDGVPTLVVEILALKDTVKVIHDRLRLFRRFRVPFVWLVDPHDQTVIVYEDGKRPAMFNVDQELSADPHLPGLRVPVSRLFE
jgi:Uma2 family endonuclease